MKNLIAELRNNKNLSQLELAEMLNVTQQTLSSWEIGRTIPKPYQMQYLEDILGEKKENIFFEDFNYKMKLIPSLKLKILIKSK
ncbi:MAG: XRE family transcriptional regulator [Tenericutes bacterium HGW-Tenericutes-1]|nr:MAG: XRE family transcriptional regulator [Tenericutes bacterium HGW-Tenericutes-1]PKM95781.1 MAG: XRE family transcriptional regulator [Firmicutes bacterium HGW-Firmicutes-1]